MERYLRVNLLGPGPRLMEKEFAESRAHRGSETVVYWRETEDQYDRNELACLIDSTSLISGLDCGRSVVKPAFDFCVGIH